MKSWDETRLLGGHPGEWVVMARRHGNIWYIAGINGKDVPQTLSFDTSFLPKGKVPAKITCQPRGGFVMVMY